MYERICTQCNKIYYKTRNRKTKHNFCSSSCQSSFKTTVITTKCGTCDKEVSKPKRILDSSKSGYVFCSQSCSTSFSNKQRPKRKKVYSSCRECGCSIPRRNKLCKECRKHSYYNDITLDKAIYHKHHRSSAFALIRTRARTVLKHTKCANCSYDKHTEVCHIKAISSFPKDTLISVINSPDNLIRLCPNCHWEYDRGLLKLQI